MNNSDAISLEATREILDQPRIYGFAESLQAAVNVWRAEHRGPAIQPATRASIIADHFYWNMTTLSLAAQPGITTGTVRGQRFISIDERVLLRCKSVRRGLESSNYQTHQARDFVRQHSISGFPELDRLHLAYRLDITGLFLKDAFITLPVGNRHRFNDWVWQIWGESIESTSTYGRQRPFPVPGFGQQRYYYEDYSQRFA